MRGGCDPLVDGMSLRSRCVAELYDCPSDAAARMKPAARMEAAIEIVEALEATSLPADRFLRELFRARRYAGSKDRAAIAERVYGMLRHRGSFAWRMRSEAPRALVVASLLQGGESPASVAVLFNGEGYGPPTAERCGTAVDRSCRRAVSRRCTYAANIPSGWSRNCGARFGERLIEETVAMQSRAPIDMRVNTLKADGDDVLRLLRDEGYDVSPRATRRSAFALLPAQAGWTRRELFAAALSKSRMKHPKSRRCWWTRNPACAYSIWRRAPAARRWRWPPRCRTAARSLRLTIIRPAEAAL